MNRKEVYQNDQDENERVQTALAETAFWQDRYRKTKSQLTIAQRIIGKSSADWRTKDQLRRQLADQQKMTQELQALIPQWIDIHRQQPADGQFVLVTDGESQGFGYYLAEEKEQWLEQGHKWMPYPALK